jgi:hypothetical protein
MRQRAGRRKDGTDLQAVLLRAGALKLLLEILPV